MSKESGKKSTCPNCGGTTTFGKRRDIIEYKGLQAAVEVEGWWCAECNEAVLAGEALKRRERAFLELKAKADGLLPPAQIIEVRKQLRLSQRRAGEVLGGGPRAFQKYEGGKIPPSAAMSNLLRLLGNDPDRLSEIVSGQTASVKKSSAAGVARTAAKVAAPARKAGPAKAAAKKVKAKRAAKAIASKLDSKPRRTARSATNARVSAR